ncbi:molybdopterin-dependent oxidoreductase [Sphingomonas sp. AOB5]|uniref:molybdopterin-containing oxidoreductase family protein n=1 Tax=Sphingomonas sp. AOB5 TaxID=3034017 RepID=UPI0023F8CC3B|nr:molybdopterin-dependent oxidoreductase [Sphingomonas sp. AOB5]MDF7776449.1 molybdopterin-dependent oxidoreductase [Sphingomonas sp. AOB5]
MRDAFSFCRICSGLCGVRVTIDDDGRVAKVRGDKGHPITEGYACIKGLNADVEGTRLLHPLKRMPDGSFERIGVEQALDEIAEKLAAIIARDGPDAIATYRGTANFNNQSAFQMLPTWMQALGSASFFSSLTIDQSAKVVSMERLGIWAAGRPAFEGSDVWMLIGANPLVANSLSLGGFPGNPLKTLKSAKDQGLKLIVIDPRRTETAEFADIHLQPIPGQDVAIASGLLRIILTEGWHDAAFCARYANGLDALIAAVAPYTPELVEARAGISAHQLREAAEAFARNASRGIVRTGTGPDFSPHSNLSEHLYEAINVVCGRYLREGEPVWNHGALSPERHPRAEVIPPKRSWETSRRTRVGGYGMLVGEQMTGALVEEILEPGPGRIAALFVAGGNLVPALPDPARTLAAFASLDLMVTIDPVMTATARASHYVFAPLGQYERADITRDAHAFKRPFAQYTPALTEPPQGSELVEDWYPFWALAKRLGLSMTYSGVPLDMDAPPETETLLEILTRDAKIPLSELRRHPLGKIYDFPARQVLPPRPEATGRFEVAPPDVVAEIAEVLAEATAPGFSHLMVSRRMRETMNSALTDLPAVRQRHRYNPAFLHPDDLAELALAEGDEVEIASAHGTIIGVAAADARLRRGVLSMSHGWGRVIPEPGSDPRADGTSVAPLVSGTHEREPINAMPRFSAIPVNIRKAKA